jgi:hypothetical protein
MTLNKAQAAKALGISLRTLATRMKLGTVKYSKIEGARPFEQSVTFTYEQLGIAPPVETAPAPAPVVHDVPIAQEYEDEQPVTRLTRHTPSEVDVKAEEDLAFAEAYREGRVSDSMGNKIDGTNANWPTKGAVSLLGPGEWERGPAPDVQAHMSKALQSTYDYWGNPIVVAEAPTAGVTRGGRALAPGISQESYDAMMSSWRVRGGGRSEGEQEIASRRAEQNIRKSFPRG